MKKPLHRWKPFAEVFKSSGGHVIAPLASHDAEEGRNACTLLALFVLTAVTAALLLQLQIRHPLQATQGSDPETASSRPVPPEKDTRS